jgi:hypothetical protein
MDFTSLDCRAKDTISSGTVAMASWEAEVPPEKYVKLYLDVLSKFDPPISLSINMNKTTNTRGNI